MVLWIAVALIGTLLLGCTAPPSSTAMIQAQSPSERPAESPTSVIVKLPEPKLEGEISLEEALYRRRSVREFSAEGLTLQEVSQLLWAGQGQTADWGGRTAPSAGATYPLELYLVAGRVDGIAAGVYRYTSEGHSLTKVADGDVRQRLGIAAVDQSWVKDAAASIVVASVYERTTGRYGDRGVTYVHIEAGHAAQNICLQAVAMDLGAVTVGAFHDDQVSDILALSGGEVPLYVIPLGRKGV